MNKLHIVLALINLSISAIAQVEFGFNVSNLVMNNELHYTYTQNVKVYYETSNDPRLMYLKDDDYKLVYDTEYRIKGINQNEFTFSTERYVGIIPRKEFVEWRIRARKLPTKELNIDSNGRMSGRATVDGEEYDVATSTDSEAMKVWKLFIEDLLTKYAPKDKRIRTTKVFQGEFVEPIIVKFSELLKNPKQYDGKRIRIDAYYNDGFLLSSFVANQIKIQDLKNALKLGDFSTFANRNRAKLHYNAIYSVDGTFEINHSDHPSAWTGDLTRITIIREAEQAAPRNR